MGIEETEISASTGPGETPQGAMGREGERGPRCAFVIFGATGDLSARKLLPALYALHQDERLHPETRVIGYGRSDWSDERMRDYFRESLREHGDGFDEEIFSSLATRLHYVRGEYGSGEGIGRLASLLERLGQENRVFYTATPPTTYVPLVDALGQCGLHESSGWVRLVVEKPFGHDLASARELNELILDRFSERQIYRIDHYLAKETAQNLAVLRFANSLFEPVWSNRYIDHVQLTMSESVGVEGRGGFYEESGVVRDVFQNHLLQLLALVAMEPPARYDATSVRNEKVKVLSAMACVEPGSAVLGQYVGGNGMAGYREEEDVPGDSRQATYAAARFEIANWRWSGVPFYVRSGKRLECKATEIVLRFKKPPHIPFSLEEELKADRLVLRFTPDEGISLRFNTKTPGQGIGLERASLDFSYASRFQKPNPEAYETLLLDTMVGDATLFMRADEVETQWRIVEPLLRQQEAEEPHPYPAGSMGPEAAEHLLESQGRHWHRAGDRS